MFDVYEKSCIFAEWIYLTTKMDENKIVIYQTEDGQTQIDVRLENETVWLTQAQMAELFQTDRTSIVRHINNIYKVEELDRESTCAKNAQVQIEGNRVVKRNIPYFNLDMIISVGYRVYNEIPDQTIGDYLSNSPYTRSHPVQSG